MPGKTPSLFGNLNPCTAFNKNKEPIGVAGVESSLNIAQQQQLHSSGSENTHHKTMLSMLDRIKMFQQQIRSKSKGPSALLSAAVGGGEKAPTAAKPQKLQNSSHLVNLLLH